MTARPVERDRILNVLVFGGFALVSIPGLVPARPRSALASFTLLGLAALGYWYASKGKPHRVVSVLAFLLGWFWDPLVALVLLVLVAVVTEAPRGAAARRRRLLGGEPDDVERALLLLDAVRQRDGRIRGFDVPFASPLGEGRVPLLLVTPRGEEAVYVEPGVWNESRERSFLAWLEKLRASERGGLRVHVHAREAAPAKIREAAEGPAR